MFGRGKKQGQQQVMKEYQNRYTLNRDMQKMQKKGYAAQSVAVSSKPDMGGKFTVLYVRQVA
jgi:hypothetical protein